MYLWILLAVVIGAALLAGGFYFGLHLGRQKSIEAEPIQRRTHKPKCYVIDPKDFGEEEQTE
jgi:flagellar basal body-associated protein FliL